MFIFTGCMDDSSPKIQYTPEQVRHMSEHYCPTSPNWTEYKTNAVGNVIKACLESLPKCQQMNENTRGIKYTDELTESEMYYCDNTYPITGEYIPPFGGSIGTGTGDQSTKSVNFMVEIINFAANLTRTAGHSTQELVEGTNSARLSKIFTTLTKLNPLGQKIVVPAASPYTVTIQSLSSKWYNNGFLVIPPSKLNDCSFGYVHTFAQRVARRIDQFRDVTYSFNQGSSGADWGDYLIEDNTITRDYNQTYMDKTGADYHVSIIGVDAFTGIAQVDQSFSP